MSSALHRAGYLVNYPIIQLANFLDSKPILNITINEYFWGYEDALVRLASGVVPNFINFKKFGLLDRVSIRQKSKTISVLLKIHSSIFVENTNCF